MPLTKYQKELAGLLAVNRTPDSHLAGGAALHFSPNSTRYSNDLDYFHDSVERVATAFSQDEVLLKEKHYSLTVEIKQPGYIRCLVRKQAQATKIEWSHDSAWRFMPVVKNPDSGYQLDPLDLSINKVLALAGRDEPRDFYDLLFINKTILSLGALCWAAAGKDPGFSPRSLLELLKRRGRYRPEDFDRLKLKKKVKLPDLKAQWLEALEKAESFVLERPAEEIGCLYYSLPEKKFIAPGPKDKNFQPHYGRPGGVLPGFLDS